MKTISVARDFSVYPGGRVPGDGPASGKEFRERFLVPALEGEEQVAIELDGVRGYAASFLEEAFGGLVRDGVAPETIREKLVLKSKRPGLAEEIERYIDGAAESASGTKL